MFYRKYSDWRLNSWIIFQFYIQGECISFVRVLTVNSKIKKINKDRKLNIVIGIRTNYYTYVSTYYILLILPEVQELSWISVSVGVLLRYPTRWEVKGSSNNWNQKTVLHNTDSKACELEEISILAPLPNQE